MRLRSYVTDNGNGITVTFLPYLIPLLPPTLSGTIQEPWRYGPGMNWDLQKHCYCLQSSLKHHGPKGCHQRSLITLKLKYSLALPNWTEKKNLLDERSNERKIDLFCYNDRMRNQLLRVVVVASCSGTLLVQSGWNIEEPQRSSAHA